jgi:hypothetical protein
MSFKNRFLFAAASFGLAINVAYGQANFLYANATADAIASDKVDTVNPSISLDQSGPDGSDAGGTVGYAGFSTLSTSNGGGTEFRASMVDSLTFSGGSGNGLLLLNSSLAGQFSISPGGSFVRLTAEERDGEQELGKQHLS